MIASSPNLHTQQARALSTECTPSPGVWAPFPPVAQSLTCKAGTLISLNLWATLGEPAWSIRQGFSATHFPFIPLVTYRGCSPRKYQDHRQMSHWRTQDVRDTECILPFHHQGPRLRTCQVPIHRPLPEARLRTWSWWARTRLASIYYLALDSTSAETPQPCTYSHVAFLPSDYSMVHFSSFISHIKLFSCLKKVREKNLFTES